MSKPSLLHTLLFLGHFVIAGIIVTNLYQQHQMREGQVEQLRQVARDEAALTENHRKQVEVNEALLDGLRKQDPYVIELLARERLGYQSSEHREVPPPRLNP